jgi:hypothetical protein
MTLLCNLELMLVQSYVCIVNIEGNLVVTWLRQSPACQFGGLGLCPVHQLPPITNIPPMLHIHLFICQIHCIMFFSHYLCFIYVFCCQYHSTNAPYSFIHLPTTMYNVFSKYFSFPCCYHSTNAPYSFIHLPLTLYGGRGC